MVRGRRSRFVKANEKISFMARAAETVAIVGESGCGKSTFAKVLMGLEVATEGRVEFRGKDIGAVPVQKRKREDVRAMQMIFQNPFDTLNPSHTVGGQLSRVIRKFGGVQGEEVRRRVLELLDIVKLPADFYFRRPRQLSGGQKQRVGIARAFAGNPTGVVADEPVSALDVSVAAAVTGLQMEQLKWTDEAVCRAFHVPAFKIGVGQMPTYQNGETLNQIYYSDCLQSHIEQYEAALDEGLNLLEKTEGRMLGVELDLDGLLRMDSATQVTTMVEGLKGLYSPNEARRKVDLPPVEGGDTPYLQQQNYSLEALGKRDQKEDPFGSAQPAPAPVPGADATESRAAVVELFRKAIAA
jgi:ABC-type dipeptide/oligopeptide/nickel transport system ATPase subunit